MPSFDQGTWLAVRGAQVRAKGERNVAAFALPGAKLSITQEELDAHHGAGRSEHEIVGQVNAAYVLANAARFSAHRRWVTDAYGPALQRIREAALVRRAEALKQAAALARIAEQS